MQCKNFESKPPHLHQNLVGCLAARYKSSPALGQTDFMGRSSIIFAMTHWTQTIGLQTAKGYTNRKNDRMILEASSEVLSSGTKHSSSFHTKDSVCVSLKQSLHWFLQWHRDKQLCQRCSHS